MPKRKNPVGRPPGTPTHHVATRLPEPEHAELLRRVKASKTTRAAFILAAVRAELAGRNYQAGYDAGYKAGYDQGCDDNDPDIGM